jgi:hypothetical protein
MALSNQSAPAVVSWSQQQVYKCMISAEQMLFADKKISTAEKDYSVD